jgi:hypothetical protein
MKHVRLNANLRNVDHNTVNIKMGGANPPNSQNSKIVENTLQSVEQGHKNQSAEGKSCWNSICDTVYSILSFIFCGFFGSKKDTKENNLAAAQDFFNTYIDNSYTTSNDKFREAFHQLLSKEVQEKFFVILCKKWGFREDCHGINQVKAEFKEYYCYDPTLDSERGVCESFKELIVKLGGKIT